MILFHKGRSWIPARSYAIEMLKLFPNSITKAYPDSEDFIQEVNTFTRRILTTRGLCSLAKRPTSEEVAKGTYTIKGTDAFFSLIRPGEYQVY